MLSIGNMIVDQEDYYLNLATGDYYLKGGEPPGRWLGSGADRLGLKGEVTAAQLKPLFQGLAPDGRRLVQPPTRGKHQPGWDLTFSAPKSVSVAWAVASPEVRRVIQDCQAAAVQAAVTYLEENAAETRRGKGGKVLEPVRLVVAGFEHGTSRAQDPQLHTHCLVVNVATREDGSTGTIVSKNLYHHKMTAGAIYRAELAHRLQMLLGVATERHKNWFELSGVPQNLMDEFSKRRKAILEHLDSTGYSSAAAAAIANHETRCAKVHTPRIELFAEWEKVGKDHGFTNRAVNRLLNRAPALDPQKEFAACWSQAISDITSRRSHFCERDVVRRVAELAPGRGLSSTDLITAVRSQLSNNPQLVALGLLDTKMRFTTTEMLDIEKKMIDTIEQVKNHKSHVVSQKVLDGVLNARPTITQEQAKAVEHLTRSSGSVAVVSGMAGTGKTFMLDACREAWERQGYKVYGAALAGKAAKGLENGSGIKSATIASKLNDLEKGATETLAHHAKQLVRAALDKPTYKQERFALTPKSILVIDEAGMVGTRQMAKLVDAVGKSGAKLVLVGDAKQLQPIEAGGVLSALTSRTGQVELTNITRQRQEWARDAVHQIANGDAAAALRMFAERGFLSVSDTQQKSMERLVADWKVTGFKKPEDNLILTSTNREAAAINRMCQEIRLEDQRRGVRFSAQINNTEVREGDRILFTKNSKQHRVCNGDLATVSRIDEPGRFLKAKLDRGGEVLIPLKDYQNIQLGYAVTTHKAQGMTVENAFVLVGGDMQDREISYVQASRAKGETRMYANKSDVGDTLSELARKMEKSRMKDLAIDVITNPKEGSSDEPRQSTRKDRPPEKNSSEPTEPRPANKRHDTRRNQSTAAKDETHAQKRALNPEKKNDPVAKRKHLHFEP